MLTHLRAKAIVDALPNVTRVASLFLRAVSWHETNYAAGWKPGEGAGSNNMGAITTLHPDQYSFKHVDSLFDDKLGAVRAYVTYFAGDPSPELGFARLRDTILKPNVREALATNDFLGGVSAMYDNGYFMGLHTHALTTGGRDNIEDYWHAVMKAVGTIGHETGESQPDVTPPPVAA